MQKKYKNDKTYTTTHTGSKSTGNWSGPVVEDQKLGEKQPFDGKAGRREAIDGSLYVKSILKRRQTLVGGNVYFFFKKKHFVAFLSINNKT